MTSTNTSWKNEIQNGYIYLPIPSELVDDHSLVVDSNWQFSAHNPTCAWSCGQNCSTLVHKVDHQNQLTNSVVIELGKLHGCVRH